MSIDAALLKKIIEGALMAAGKPMSVKQLIALFSPSESGELDLQAEEMETPSKEEILATLEDIQNDCAGRGYELHEVSSGWRFQVIQDVAPWVTRMWEEKPQRYTRALLETLALIAYRQPITRGDIESIRGVAVSSNIIKTLTEREWVKVVGHRDVPGRPALFATTREFLDYFNLKNLDDLPSLREITDLDQLGDELDFGDAIAEMASEDASQDGKPNDAVDASDDSDALPSSANADDEEISDDSDYSPTLALHEADESASSEAFSSETLTNEVMSNEALPNEELSNEEVSS